jgi:hypothetical protein
LTPEDAMSSARRSVTVSALNNMPGVSTEPSAWVGGEPNVSDARARCSLTYALPEPTGSHSTRSSMAPSRAAAAAANSAPIRIPTSPTRVTPECRITSSAAATLPSHASTRPGSSVAPNESPVPS